MRYLLFILTFFLPLTTLAHGLATTYRQPVGNYVVEFEYNDSGNIQVGDYILYDLYLLKSANSEPVDYDSAFIRIEKKNGSAVMAANLAESKDIKGYASMAGILNEPGDYTAEATFYKNNDSIAEAKFIFTVDPLPDMTENKINKKFYLALETFLAGIILAGTIMFVFYRFKKQD